MAGKSSNGKGGNSSASVNIEGDTSITVTQTNNVQKTVNTSSAKESSTGTVTTSTSKTSSEEPKRVDTGNTTSKRVFSREDLKALSDSVTGALKDNKDDLKDETIEQISKFLEEADKRQAERDKERRDREEKEAAERSEKEKEKAKEIEEEFKAKETAATNRAAAALNAYSAHLQKMEEEHKSTTLAEIAKAAPKAAANAAKIGGAGTAFGVEALNAVNPALGTMAQMFMSKDGLGPYFRSFFGTMKDATKDAFNNKVKEAELEEEIIDSLKDSAVNVKDLLKLTADIKNIDVQKLLNAQDEDIPGMFGGGKSKTAVSDAVKKSASSDDLPSVKADSTKTGGSDKAMSDAIKDSQIKQEGAFTKLTNAISTLSSSIMPKKTGSEAAHETAVKDMFGRKEGGEKEKTAKSDAWKEIFGALKQGLIATLGLLALYFSGDQFKALLKDMVLSPFRSIGNHVSKWWDDIKSHFGWDSKLSWWQNIWNNISGIAGDTVSLLTNLVGDFGGILKFLGVFLVGAKLLLGKFFPLGSILKIGAKGVVMALKGAVGIVKGIISGIGNMLSGNGFGLGDISFGRKKKGRKRRKAKARARGRSASKRKVSSKAKPKAKRNTSNVKNLKNVSKAKQTGGLGSKLFGATKVAGKGIPLASAITDLGFMAYDIYNEKKENGGTVEQAMDSYLEGKKEEEFSLWDLADPFGAAQKAAMKVGVDKAARATIGEWGGSLLTWWDRRKNKKPQDMTDKELNEKISEMKKKFGANYLEENVWQLELNKRKGKTSSTPKEPGPIVAKAEETKQNPVSEAATTVVDAGINSKVVNKEVAPVVDNSKKVKTAEMIDSSKDMASKTSKIKSETINQLVERKVNELINVVQRKQTAVLNGNNLSSTIAQRR